MESFQIKRVLLTPQEIRARWLSLKDNSFKSKSVKDMSSYVNKSLDDDDRYANISKNLNKSFDFLCQQKTVKNEKIEEIFERMNLTDNQNFSRSYNFIDPKVSFSMPTKNCT